MSSENMAYISIKNVPEELKRKLQYLSAAMAVSESKIILTALENFSADNEAYVQQGKKIVEGSPMRKE